MDSMPPGIHSVNSRTNQREGRLYRICCSEYEHLSMPMALSPECAGVGQRDGG